MGIALIIALALSLDGFGVGMAYGLQRIKIPFESMCIIGLCTALAMGSSMLLGHILIPSLTFISPHLLGAGVLIAIGGYQLILALKNSKPAEKAVPVMTTVTYDPKTYKTLLSIKLRVFGLIIQVLKTPDVADLDGSGSISPKEGILLGIALALDTFAAGIAATMTGIPIYVIGFVAIIQILMISAGQALTGRLPSEVLDRVKFLPGTILVVIGSLKMI